MFRRIRWRIAVPYVALILGVMAIVVIYLSSTVRRIYLESLEAQLTGEAVLIGDALAPSAPWSQTENLNPAAYRYARLLGARVTIIRSDGTVLGESHRSRIGMDNHLGRPEVQQALREGAGSSIRYSETVGYDMLYVAVRVGPVEEEPVGFARVALPLSEADARVSNLQRTLLVGALVTTLFAAGLAIAMAERTARPIRRLTAVAERLAAGDLGARLLPSGRDEVTQLTRAFNNMAGQLRSQVDTLAREQSRLSAILENAASGIIITDDEGHVELINPAAARLLDTTQERALGSSFAQAVRHHQLIELWQRCREEQEEQSGVVEIVLQDLFLQVIIKPFRDAGVRGYLAILQDLTRIRRLETVRRDFISNISHELRTPMAGLKALVDTLRDGALDDPPVARRFLDRMEGEVDALTQMVEELLELSRIESGKIPLRLRPTPVSEVVVPPVERLRPQAERAGLELTMDLPDDLPSCMADAERAQRVVTNLVHNALKFTPAGGRVQVSAREASGPLSIDGEEALGTGRWIVVAVHDDGTGIDPDDLARIFERFYKADRARSSGGTGLGLAIAKHVVQGHGGHIWAESPSSGPYWEDGSGRAEQRDPRRRGSTFYFALVPALVRRG